MIDYRFYSYSDDIIRKSISDLDDGRSIFIYPTAKAVKTAQRVYQEDWQLSGTAFLTMEEFKELFFPSSLPILKEDKRSLALYNSVITAPEKSLYNGSYFSFIKFAANFFAFWEEFNEENIRDDKSLSGLLPDADILDWQENLYRQMQTVKKVYRDYLAAKGWSDKLFLHRIDNIDSDHFLNSLNIPGECHNFVFVNQYYYTKLEQKILQTLAGTGQFSGNRVTVCYQLPEKCVVKKTNTVDPELSPFEKRDSIRVKRIFANVTSNDFDMLTNLIKAVEHSKEKLTVIDKGFSFREYSRFLSPQKFSDTGSTSFTNVSLYRFLQQLESLTENAAFFNHKGKERLLLPLKTLSESVTDDIFFDYFRYLALSESHLFSGTAETGTKPKIDRHAVLGYLSSLADNDYFYLDLLNLEPGISDDLSCRAIQFLEMISVFLQQLLKISSIPAFIGIINQNGGIKPEKIITSNEKASDVLTVFYKTAANFLAIDEIGLLEESTFGNHSHPIKWILKLFLQALKPKRIKFNYQSSKAGTEISSLLDSRCLAIDNLAILNLSEGIYPTSRSTPFLLTEQQRKVLGLKTYEDIRNREKYYFFRLVLNSRNVYLFSQQNSDTNIEKSSFVEELSLLLKDIVDFTVFDKINTNAGNLSTDGDHIRVCYESLFPAKNADLPTSEYLPEAFFTLPFNKAEDLKNNTLPISFYRWLDMKDSPFTFYLRSIAGIEEEQPDKKPLSERLIGTIAHAIFNEYWKNYSNDRPAESLNQSAAKVLESEELYLKIPKNYSAEFFRCIVLPTIKQCVLDFIEKNDILINSGSSRIIPEDKTLSARLETAKDLEIKTVLRGRVDLIIEERANTKQDTRSAKESIIKHIFDYKTGKVAGNKFIHQLVIYELINGLKDLEETAPENVLDYLETQVNSYLYSLLDADQIKLTEMNKKSTKRELITGFLEELEEVLEQIISQGYKLNEAKSANKIHREITRADIYASHRRTASAQRNEQ